jgi:hypothetical protein
MIRLTRTDVAVMQAAALLFPNMLPAASNTPAANLGYKRIEKEGLALIEELEALALDHAAVAGGDPAEFDFGLAVEDATQTEQAARAMTMACHAAIDAFGKLSKPDWVIAQLREGKRRLETWAELTTGQRSWVMDLRHTMIAEGVDVPDF